MTPVRLKRGEAYTDETSVLYRPGAHGIVDLVMEDGMTQIQRKPVAPLLAEGYLELPLSEASKRCREAGYAEFCGPITETTQEAFDEALNCLPPEAYYYDSRGCCFRMMEYFWADVTQHYAAVVGGKYYTQKRRVGDQKEFMDAVVAFHGRSEFANSEQEAPCQKS